MKVYILFSPLNMQQGVLYGQGGAVNLTLTQSTGLLSHCPLNSLLYLLPYPMSFLVLFIASSLLRLEIKAVCVILCFKIPSPYGIFSIAQSIPPGPK